MNKEPRLTDIDKIAAACSDCGNCLAACPVYSATLLEPDAPRGKVNIIKALRDGRLEPSKRNRDMIYHCVLCGSCQYVCTKGVRFTDLMIQHRNEISGGKQVPRLKKIILYFYQSVLFKKFSWFIGWLARTPLRRIVTLPRRRPANLSGIQSRAGSGVQPDVQPDVQYDILLFPGCVLSRFYPQIIEKIYRRLTDSGFSVVLPKDLQCCGFPYKTQGWDHKFKQLKSRNDELFSQYKFKYIVAPCGSCTVALTDFYHLKDVEIFELSQFYYKFLADAPIDKQQFHNAQEGNITFHHPCHHLKSLGIKDAPNHFMKQLGDRFADDDSGLCCGFGGIFSVGFPDTSKKILERKKEKWKELGTGTVVTSCPGCYLHLRENSGKEVKFFIDLFESESNE